MAWRAALDSLPLESSSPKALTSYEKGQVVAILGLLRLYAEADVNSCVAGLDAEALCGFFKTLVSPPPLPPSIASPAPHLPSSSTPPSAPVAPPPPPSSPPPIASLAEDDSGATSLRDLEEWLKKNPCQKFTKVEDVFLFLGKAPISSKAYKFIEKHLLYVPKGDTPLHFRESSGEKYFLRNDYFAKLAGLGRREVKVVMLTGRKRFGKTISLPHELVRARQEVLGARDRVLFFYPGYGHVPELQFPLIIRLLAHMKIPALFDEFTVVPGIHIGKAYKLLQDTAQDIEPLSAVLFGSDEVTIWNKRFEPRATVERLPVPPLCVMYSMLLWTEPHLQGCELGLRFLRKIALYGYDLSNHTHAELPESLETLKKTALQAFGSFHGGYLTTLENILIIGSGAEWHLQDLLQSEYILQKPNNSLAYDFMDPQTVAYQACKSLDSLEKVEEKVLEHLLRLQKHLLGELLCCLDLRTSPALILHYMWCGSLSKGCKVELLFFDEKEAFLVLTKRLRGAHNWQSSFVRSMDTICKEWKHLDQEVREHLAAAKRLRFVAVSAGDGSIGGTKPSSYSTTLVTEFQPKEVTCESIFLHQLLEKLDKVECYN